MKNKKTTNPFTTAMNYLIRKKGRGSMAELADKVKISPGYASNLRSGVKYGTEEIRAKISAFLGYDYLVFLTLGKWIQDGKNPEDWPPSSLDKDNLIKRINEFSDAVGNKNK